MDKIKVIFRKDKTDGTIIAFFPESTAKAGNIVCYEHIGQHGEASLEYFYSTTKASSGEYEELYKELCGIYAFDGGKLDPPLKLSIRQRLCYNDLTEKAWA